MSGGKTIFHKGACTMSNDIHNGMVTIHQLHKINPDITWEEIITIEEIARNLYTLGTPVHIVDLYKAFHGNTLAITADVAKNMHVLGLAADNSAKQCQHCKYWEGFSTSISGKCLHPNNLPILMAWDDSCKYHTYDSMRLTLVAAPKGKK